MSEPSKKDLWANKFLRSLKNKLVHCYVCPDDTSFVSWQDHISKASHIKNLEEFNATFESQGTNVRCKLCDKDFARTEIKTHAKLHSNCVDNYQRFFENNIVEWKDKFYCYPCNVIFLDAVTAIKHIEKSTHKNLRGKSASSAEFTAAIPPNVSYILLVSEGLAPVDNTRLNCKFCNFDVLFSNSREHVHGSCHWYFKNSFNPTTADRKTKKTDTKAVSQNKKVTESRKSSNESPIYWYFENIDKTSVYCKVCYCSFEDTEENTKLHLQGKIHLDSLQKYGCDYISLKGGFIYYCECCKLSFSNRKTIYLHIKEKTHRDSTLLSNKLKLLTSSMETTKSVVVPTNIPCNYIVRLNTVDFYCKVCDVKLSEATIMGKHSWKSSDNASLSKYNDNSTFSTHSSVTSCNCNHTDDEYFGGSEAPEKVGQSRKTTMRNIIELLDFHKDYIYEMKEKKRLIRLGIESSFIINHQRARCLICRQNFSKTPHKYFEHLCSKGHMESLDVLGEDSAPCEDKFRAIDFACRYMEVIDDMEEMEEIVMCNICDKEFTWDNDVIQNHIHEEQHEFNSDVMYIFAKENFKDFESRMECDWYNVHKYWCVPCSANFESEVNFVKHLESKKHWAVTSKWEYREKPMMFDFCAPCALLWYGCRKTYSYHCDVPSHKWLLRNGHHSLPGLPELAKNLLARSEHFVGDIVHYLDGVAAKEKKKEKGLIEDLEKAVGRKFFPPKVYVYGSRASGLGSPDSDIDVFLDFDHRYNEHVKSENLFNLMKQVEQCLNWDSATWDVIELLTECRPPVIRANHRASGLFCDISVENGLSVENTKLVQCFNEIFSPCRKLILFLKQWLVFCNLSGSDCISSYALCWYVIFYLQKRSILPSIATLISMNKRSKTVAGWEVGVTHDFRYNEFESLTTPYGSLRKHLIGFFKFYANFNFRHDVACPLLGEEIEKRAFTDPRKLPKEMAPYIAYIEKSSHPEPLRIDSVMCIQDPFDLQHNITKAVSKVFLCRFRTCCSKSLDVLGSAEYY